MSCEASKTSDDNLINLLCHVLYCFSSLRIKPIQLELPYTLGSWNNDELNVQTSNFCMYLLEQLKYIPIRTMRSMSADLVATS